MSGNLLDNNHVNFDNYVKKITLFFGRKLKYIDKYTFVVGKYIIYLYEL